MHVTAPYALQPIHTSIYNVTPTHNKCRKHNGSLCLLTTFVYWLAGLTQRARLLFQPKDASSRILCFLCPLCLSLVLSSMEGG